MKSTAKDPAFLPHKLALAVTALTLVATSFAGCTTPWPTSMRASSTSAAQTAKRDGAPIAPEVPQKLEIHGDVRIDNYYWMRDRENKAVVDYLKAENEYARKVMSPTETLQATLYEEMKGRIKQDDSTVPQKEGEYFYYRRNEIGQEYPIFCRKKGSLEAPEEILLNVNEEAQGSPFFFVPLISVSPDGKKIAYPVDTAGNNKFTIRFKDLTTGKTLEESIPAVTASLAWANDNQTLFYVKQDETTLRPNRVFRHKLGEKNDPLIYEERDETFDLTIRKSLTKKFIFVESHSTLSTETRYLDAKTPTAHLTVFLPRENNHEYDIEDGGDRFFIHTNDKARNFRLMETPYARTDKKAWKEVVPHRADTLLEGVQVFKTHIALQERRGGLTRIQALDRRSNAGISVPFKESSYVAYLHPAREYENDWMRFEYESLATPSTVMEYSFSTGRQVVRKRTEVLGGFKSENYETHRLFAKASDGTQIPISIVYRKDLKRRPSNPLLINGYGAYGISYDPGFESETVSLLDRGFVLAIAHVRGGSEMGRYWYEDGRQFKKKNTFTDFIACTEYLQKEGYSSPAHTYASGGSAGGLLMGAVLNMRPELYNGIIAAVPFVDVMTTMLDKSLPLTTAEFDEWGNPENKAAYDYMRSYSPYDNVEAKPYTNLFVRTGLNDSQVSYWEPTKWVAKLRKMKTDDKLVLLRVNMESGHSGKSGRFERLTETALEYAFLLKLEGFVK